VKSFAVHVWRGIQEPRIVTLIQTGIYLVTFAVGIDALLDPPVSVRGAIGPVLTTCWAVFLVLGGALGAVAAPPGVWWLERVGVMACMSGLLIYGAVLVALHVTSPDGNRLPLAGVTLIATGSFLVRWFRIRRYAYDPEALSTRD